MCALGDDVWLAVDANERYDYTTALTMGRFFEEEMDRRGKKTGLFSSKYEALWKFYEDRHGDYSGEDKQTFLIIFGPQFARKYAEAAGEDYELQAVDILLTMIDVAHRFLQHVENRMGAIPVTPGAGEDHDPGPQDPPPVPSPARGEGDSASRSIR